MNTAILDRLSAAPTDIIENTPMTTVITYPRPTAKAGPVEIAPATISLNRIPRLKQTGKPPKRKSNKNPHARYQRNRNPFTQRGFTTLLRIEAQLWLRHPAAVISGLAFSTIFIVLNGLISPTFASEANIIPGSLFDGLTGLQIMLPAFLMMSAVMPFVAIVPAEFGGLREKGVLKRFSGSPMSPLALIFVHYLINLGAALAGATTALLISGLIWGITIPQNVGTVIVGWVLGTLAMAAFGTLIAARVTKASSGNAIGLIGMFTMLIFSGTIGSVAQTNGIFRNIARFSPVGAATQIMEYGWHGVGYGFPLTEFLVLLGWTLALSFAGVKLFRWR